MSSSARTTAAHPNATNGPFTGQTPWSAAAWTARYERRGELGRGGMGAVHAAYDTSLGREVALKILIAPDPSPEAIARFTREARITGQIAHPNIPPVYELGLTPEGQPFLAMKLVRGSSLRDHLDARREAPRDTSRFDRAHQLDVLARVGEALRCAHAHGVIHRDLKPDNVMIGEFSEVLVMDWGLAKQLDAVDAVEPTEPGGGESSPLRTQDGAVAGTPAYMAPEQARGEIAALDARTDVFALGALLYEMLTLSPPYVGGTVFATLTQAQEAAWLPVAERLRLDRSGGPTPPPELASIAHRAMAAEPAQRYASVEDMLADLRAFREHRPVSAHRDGVRARAVKWTQRHPQAALVLACALVLGLVSSQLSAARERQRAQALQASAERDLAMAKERAERERADQLAQTADLIFTDEAKAAVLEFERVWTAAQASGMTPAQFRAKVGDQEVARFLSAHEGLFRVCKLTSRRPTAEDHAHRAVLRHLGGNLAGARDDLDQALALSPSFVWAIVLRAGVRQALGDLEGALADSDLALTLNPSHVSAIGNRGIVRAAKGELAASIADFDRAIGLNPEYADAYCNRGTARRLLGDAPGAIADYTKAIALEPRNVDALVGRAIAHHLTGAIDRAIADYDRAIELDPRSVDAWVNRGFAHHERGEPKRALADYDEAIALDPRRVAAYIGRGDARLACLDVAGAKEDFDQAIALDSRNAVAFQNRAVARSRSGDAQGALADYDRAIELDPRMTAAYVRRGRERQGLGDLDGALVDFDRAIELDPRSADARYRRGVARQAKGSTSEAMADYDQAHALDPSNPEILYSRGNARFSTGDFRGAIAEYDQALGCDATYWRAAGNRGTALARLGDTSGAVRSYLDAYRQCPDAAARQQLAELVRQLGGTVPPE